MKGSLPFHIDKSLENCGVNEMKPPKKQTWTLSEGSSLEKFDPSDWNLPLFSLKDFARTGRYHRIDVTSNLIFKPKQTSAVAFPTHLPHISPTLISPSEIMSNSISSASVVPARPASAQISASDSVR